MGMMSNTDQEDVMLEVNMTPLIDVMLVLIIMFIITIPIQNDAININLPTESVSQVEQPPTITQISILPDGRLLWNDQAINIKSELEQRLITVAQQGEKNQIQIRPAHQTAYKEVAMVMAMAQRLGIKNMGIVNYD